MESLDLAIKEVESKIKEVESKIKEVEDRLKNEQDPDGIKYLRKKEEQLREEKRQLREKEERLRKEKEQLREENLLLRDPMAAVMESLDLAIKEVESKIKEVEDQLKNEQDPDGIKYLREEKLLLRKKEEQLWEENLLLLKATVPHGSGKRHLEGSSSSGPLAKQPKYDWSNPDTRLNKLLELFEIRVQHARKLNPSTDRDPKSDLPASLALIDIGKYFPILGREATIEELLKGTWRLYKQFMNLGDTGWDTFRRLAHLMGVVAFPGAGKTSIGQALAQVLRQARAAFSSDGERRQHFAQLVSCSVEDAGEIDELFKGVEGYDVLMYHDFVGLSPSEENLAAAQLLGLRTLHAACTRPDGEDIWQQQRWEQYHYTKFLGDLDAQASGLKYHLTFDDVIRLLRRVLGFEEDDRFFASFFFDEVGRANGHFQKMVREWICWVHDNKGGTTFVTMVGATNIFSAASLKESGDTGSSELIYIPVTPLASDVQSCVVLSFINRLGRSANVPEEVTSLTKELAILLKLSGGNPRIMSWILQAVESTDETVRVVPAKFHAKLLKHFDRQGLRDIVDRVWALMVNRKYLSELNQLGNSSHIYVLRAIQASLLRQTVSRKEALLNGTGEQWHWFESVGLVGTMPSSGDPDKVRVVFSPMYLLHLSKQRDDFFGQRLPDLSNMQGDGWKDKEDSHLSTVVFSIYLLKELRRPGPTDTFNLSEVLPEDWLIPEHLKTRKFLFPSFPAQIQRSSPRNKEDVTSSEHWVYVGPRNDGFDTLVVLQEPGVPPKPFLLFNESKCVGDPKKEPHANWNGVVAPKIISDIEDLVDVRSIDPKKFGLDSWGLLFISDMNNTGALKAQQGYLAEPRIITRSTCFNLDQELAKRVVIAGGFGLVDSISAIRKVSRN